MIKRIKDRAGLLIHSRTIHEFIENITPFTLEFIMAIPLFLYVIQPMLIVPEGFRGKIDIFLYRVYALNLMALAPVILLIWAFCIFVMIMKMHYSHTDICTSVKSNPIYMLFILCMITMLISVLVDGPTGRTLFGDEPQHEGILSYYGYIAVLFFLASMITDRRIKKVICDATLISSLPVCAFAYWRCYIQDSVMDVSGYDDHIPTAFFGHFNCYGYYLAVNIMLAAALFVVVKKKGWKLFYLITFAINVWMLNLNNTFGAWLACFCGFIFMIIAESLMNGRLMLRSLFPMMAFLAITVLMSIFWHGMLGDFFRFFSDVKEVASDPSHADEAGTSRWVLWKETIKLIKRKPLSGYGIEGIGSTLMKKCGTTRAHSEILQYAATFGIPNAILYSAATVGVFIRAIRNRKSLGLITFACLTSAFTYYVSAMFGNSMYATAPFFFIFLGLGYRSQFRIPR